MPHISDDDKIIICGCNRLGGVLRAWEARANLAACCGSDPIDQLRAKRVISAMSTATDNLSELLDEELSDHGDDEDDD